MTDYNERQTAYLFVNLGTPDAPTPTAIYPYLREFLLDKHVVDLPVLWWKFLLTKVILPIRIKKTAANYRKIWTESGSPLLVHSQRLVKNIMACQPHKPAIRLAMTYGNPSLKHVLTELQGYAKIKIVPLFPQYSTTTTQAVIDKIAALVVNWPTPPQLEYITDYADEHVYIEALLKRAEDSFQRHGIPDVLLLSYHGIPIKYIKKREDSYAERCQITTDKLTQQLRKKGITIPVVQGYQSRFGQGKWTEPNITPLLSELAQNDIKHVQVMCPGFAVDCVETLEEIALFNKNHFFKQGGKRFHYIPALNDSDKHCQLMISLMDQPGALVY